MVCFHSRTPCPYNAYQVADIFSTQCFCVPTAQGSGGLAGRLHDFYQYAIGLRGEMRLQSSIHVHFQSDEIAHRAIIRADGQPLWD